MSHLTTLSKIQKFIEENVIGQLKAWAQLLRAGHLYAYETEALGCIHGLYDFISEQLLPEAALQIADQLVDQGRASGGRKIEVRPFKLRIATGQQVEVQSPYVKQPGKGWNGPRQLLAVHWNIIDGASPALYDRVGYCAALGPSYEMAHQTLGKFGVQLCLSSVRDITNRLANHCFESGEENVIASPGETLEGERVVISIDGGRTRTRSYDDNYNDSGMPLTKQPRVSQNYSSSMCWMKMGSLSATNYPLMGAVLPKLMCGSGIIESAIRSLINLRIQKCFDILGQTGGGEAIFSAGGTPG